MPLIRSDELVTDAHAAVVIVGAGACGLTAALAARDAGAAAMVLERNATPMNTTSMSQGFVAAADTRSQRDAGIEDSAAVFFQDIMAKTAGRTDEVMAHTIARESGPTVDWLVDRHAVPLSISRAWGPAFGHSRPRLHGTPTQEGSELLASLLQAAEAAGADLVTAAQVTDIYANREDRIIGVGLTRPDGARERLGCDSLVLATCGFASNRAMLRDHVAGGDTIPIWAPEAADGSGIAWGIALGAATADMDAFQGHGAMNAEAGIQANFNIVMDGGIQVNAAGERFSNEVANISGQGSVVFRQPGGFAWMVFDERLHQNAMAWPGHRQLQELGMIRAAPDAAALAARIDVPAAALERTLGSVTAMSQGARDPFGRDFTGHMPLGRPLFAIRCIGALLHTQGGLVVDSDARVCRPDGTRLPNLFAGGGTARSISGPGDTGYLPAAGLCMALTLGRLAGTGAARLAQHAA
jgi:fumarate reductase flavoprotein subunit